MPPGVDRYRQISIDARRSQVPLDIDDHHAALGLFARRGYHRSLHIASMAIDGKLNATTLAFATLLLFLLEDLFDYPGIQHCGPPFGQMCGLTSRTHASVSVAPIGELCNLQALGPRFVRKYSNALKFAELHFRSTNSAGRESSNAHCSIGFWEPHDAVRHLGFSNVRRALSRSGSPLPFCVPHIAVYTWPIAQVPEPAPSGSRAIRSPSSFRCARSTDPSDRRRIVSRDPSTSTRPPPSGTGPYSGHRSSSVRRCHAR